MIEDDNFIAIIMTMKSFNEMSNFQIYFQTNNMFSAESIYDALFLTLYNVMYTSLPVLFLSLTEKVYPENKLLRYIQLINRLFLIVNQLTIFSFENIDIQQS